MRALLAPLLPLLAAGCVSSPPRVASRPVQPAPRPAPPAPLPPSADWRDWPVTPGSWRYARDARGSAASFGEAGGTALATLRCDRDGGRVLLSVAGAGALPLTVRTSSVARTLAPTGGAVGLPAADPLLDAMAFSRGRFALSSGPAAPLVLPAWAEVGRVVEDCRG